MPIESDSPHPIINDLSSYEITGFSYHRELDDWTMTHFDLILQRPEDKLIRRLRFLSPHELRIDGIPDTSGMEILDINNRQWEGVSVWVNNYENAGNAITLWAREVIDLDEVQ